MKGAQLKVKSKTDQKTAVNNSRSNRLTREFYARDVLNVAPALLGKSLVLRLSDRSFGRYTITEAEAYRGEEDRACHAFRGRTTRTEIMYAEGGRVYVYFVYGMYWMLNIVTGNIDEPQAALIRGLKGFPGPGILTRDLGINGSFYGEDLVISERMWIEDTGYHTGYVTTPRIGIGYAGEPWISKPWRFEVRE